MCSHCHTDSIKWSYHMCGIIPSTAQKHSVNASDILWVTVVRHQRLTLRVKHGCVLEERVLVDRHGTALGRGLHAGPWNREGFYKRKIRSDCVCSYKRHEHKTAQGLLGLFYAFYYTRQGGLTVGMGEIWEQFWSGFKPVTLYVMSIRAVTAPQLWTSQQIHKWEKYLHQDAWM